MNRNSFPGALEHQIHPSCPLDHDTGMGIVTLPNNTALLTFRRVYKSHDLLIGDAAQLAQTVDSILLAARLNHSPRKPIKDLADDRLIFSNIIGVALIGSLKNSYGYGKYGHYKYGYGNRGSYYGQN